MECMKCGAALGREDYCPACGTNVKVYKRIICTSNQYYNEALKLARQRDLSGAAECLRRSLKLYKLNIAARNLLGLIYFEMGETVDAIGEWVISRSLMPEDSLAEKYLSAVQSNGSKLEALNQTIKKYNQALLYCQQDSKDLAIIQLKKVLSMNPGLVKAHQLLALLYMEEGKYERARRELSDAARVDTGNLTTLRYLREVDSCLQKDVSASKGAGHKKEETASYRSGNETIIQPVNVRDMSPLMTIINLIIGVAIGALITYFLIIPTVRQNAVSEARKAELEANNELTSRTQEMNSLNQEIEDLKAKIENMEGESADTQKIIDNYEQMINVCFEYSQQNIQAAGDGIGQVDPGLLGAQAKSVYDRMNGLVNEQYMAAVYQQAEQDYNSRNFAAAITGLEKVVKAEEDHDDGYAIYHLAHSYRQTGDIENAKKYYQRMIELHPGTQRAKASQQYLDELNRQQP